MRVLLVVLVAGCLEPQDKPESSPAPVSVVHRDAPRGRLAEAPAVEMPMPVADKPPTATGPTSSVAQVTWAAVSSTNGCFFFSGPDGRDDKLIGDARFSRDGDQLTLTIDKVVFRGRITNLDFVVTRRSRHDYDGPWNVDEKITGKLLEGRIDARYRYHECEVGTKCPGPCTIDGTIVFRR